MTLFTPGRMVMKLAGRDAGRVAVVVDSLDVIHVLVDGNVRRKKVNIRHLEPLEKVIELRKGASHEQVQKAFEELQLPVWNKNGKKPAARPRLIRKSTQKKAEPEKAKLKGKTESPPMEKASA